MICGHADEPTILHFDGLLPEAEEVADLFTLLCIITTDECKQGLNFDHRIREFGAVGGSWMAGLLGAGVGAEGRTDEEMIEYLLP